MRGFTEALRQEMLIANHPVKATCADPGGIKIRNARNVTVAEGENGAGRSGGLRQAGRQFSTLEMGAELIVNGKVANGDALAVVGPAVRAVDALSNHRPAVSVCPPPHWSGASP